MFHWDIVDQVLTIKNRGYHGRRTKDIWEDQNAKILDGTMPEYMLAALSVE